MNLFSVNWWVSTFVSTFVTCMFIVLIKRATNTVNIPFVSDAMKEV